ncbi:MAG TPA: sulfotransferase [Rhizomicrobium sp.]|jgi:tetratricopeptide (TPR) repeat protein
MGLEPAQAHESGEGSASPEFVRALDSMRASRPIQNPQLREAAAAQRHGLLPQSVEILSDFLAKHPEDPDALFLLAQSHMLQQQFAEAEPLLLKVLALAPDFDAARFNLAKSLLNRNRPHDALAQLDVLLARDAGNPLYRDLKALALTALADHAAAAECYRELTQDFPTSIDLWMSYAHALRTMGRREDCIAAYRHVLEIDPSLGGAYWSLGDLKTFRFDPADIDAMNVQLKRTDLSSKNRMYFHFALGKAYADQKQYQKSFENYARANAIRRIAVQYDAQQTTENVNEQARFFTREFFAQRRDFGSDSKAPIFVVGMQRAGSTLIEQILSSHSAIEGAGELPGVPLLVKHLESEVAPARSTDYPAILAQLSAGEIRALADRYLATAQSHRALGRPFFVDKQPYNFWYMGLIRLILPNAKIIDARRHPLACCFSNFTMNYRYGFHYSYRQSDLGRYYADYVRLMAHFDAVMPGAIHRIIYERMVADTEGEIRRLLDYLGLPFEESCLRFYANERAVDTASSEQVRRPIFSEAVDHWRNFDPWLGQLKSALGPVLDSYPDAPEFSS